MSSLLISDAEVDGARVDVLVRAGVISEITPACQLRAGAEEHVRAGGGALLPGLHDHHLHLMAMAAAEHSVDCAPPRVTTAEQFAEALRGADPQRHWVRAVGYHESVAGPLDRHRLDAILADRPVRVQHSSGSLWVLNTAALDRLHPVLGSWSGFELDGEQPTGRLWRRDDLLRAVIDEGPLTLGSVGARLSAAGITSVTDATPQLSRDDLDRLTAAASVPGFTAGVTLLGAEGATELPPGWRHGARKLTVADHRLPSFDELAGQVQRSHAEGRAVAVHCVTRDALLLTLSVLEYHGVLPGDRIEHGAVVPAEAREVLARLGVAVITQPSLPRMRGDRYLHDVDAADRPLLYPWRSLSAAGVAVAPSSDAPYGDLDPWAAMRDARDRHTAAGAPIVPSESVTAETVLAGFLSRPDAPGSSIRRVAVGAPAELCLLNLPLEQALRNPGIELVRRTWTPRSVA